MMVGFGGNSRGIHNREGFWYRRRSRWIIGVNRMVGWGKFSKITLHVGLASSRHIYISFEVEDV